jgi:hypothetical protein
MLRQYGGDRSKRSFHGADSDQRDYGDCQYGKRFMSQSEGEEGLHRGLSEFVRTGADSKRT